MLLPALKKLSTRVRSDIIRMTTTAKSGHPTSSLSSVELMVTLYFKYLRYDVTHPRATNNDRIIFSKGHASPLLYALWHVAGVISDKELATYRTFGSVLEGHPTPRFPCVDIATGSLGQGLAVGLGEALAIQKIFHNSASLGIPNIFVLLGDGELSEGAVWEAVMAAGYHKTPNLIALVDINGLEQSGSTMEAWDTVTYQKRFESFGWATIVVDGHDMSALDIAYQKALAYRAGPTVILAKTVKGKGISFLENKEGWHGKVLNEKETKQAIEELGVIDTSFEGIVKKPDASMVANEKNGDKDIVSSLLRASSIQHEVPQSFPKEIKTNNTRVKTTREGFGEALVELGVENPNMIVIDGDLEKSTYIGAFHNAYPGRFFQGHIAEQLIVGIATGTAICGFYPVISSYAGFWTRAMDQFRIAALSGISLFVNGSHGGVATGADGPSQMGLEDIALFRSVLGSIVVSPADVVAAKKLTKEVFGQKGIVYLRTTRPMLPIIYDESESFPIGGSKVFGENKSKNNTKHNLVTIIGSGVPVHEALKAQKILEEKGIPTRVIDAYSSKPMDGKTIAQAWKESQTIVVVEDHYPEGGLYEAILSSFAGSDPARASVFEGSDPSRKHIVHLAVRKTPMSGSMEDLYRYEELDAKAIVDAVTSK